MKTISKRSSVVRNKLAAEATQAAEAGTLPAAPRDLRVSRRLTRRIMRKETSLEVRMVLDGQQLPGSPNKRAQKAAKRATKLRRAARFIVGLLIRATGTAAPALVATVSHREARAKAVV